MPGRKSYTKQYKFWYGAVRGNLTHQKDKRIVPASEARGATKIFKDPEGVEYAVVKERAGKEASGRGENDSLTPWERAVTNFAEAVEFPKEDVPSLTYNTYSKNDMVLLNLQSEDKADTDYTKELRKLLIRERSFPSYEIHAKYIPKAIEKLEGFSDEVVIRFDNADKYYEFDTVFADSLCKGLKTLKDAKKPLYISLHHDDDNSKHRYMAIMGDDSHFAFVADLFLETGSISSEDIVNWSKIKELNAIGWGT